VAERKTGVAPARRSVVTTVGLDDTDSRERGMCTTYVADRLARRLASEATVERCLLVRLNPAIPYKTRGNAALAVHTDADPDRALALAREAVDGAAVADDPDTNPGVVVAPGDPIEVPEPVVSFARRALAEELEPEDARALATRHGYRVAGWGVGRGAVGALAAVGAWRLWRVDGLDPTYESISYRERDRWGTDRDVDRESVFRAATAGYPAVWDTVDHVEGETVCVPHTPGPVLYGVRGETPAACREVAAGIGGEPVAARRTFVTNQGTDTHLRPGRLGGLADGTAYRVEGLVASEPETRRGGHVFFELSGDDGDTSVECVAFEPTKRFRDDVRRLRPGDRLTVCGGHDEGTLKLEKFALREPVTVEWVTPTCPGCGRRMESAGRDQGYRCRDCRTDAPGRVERPVERELERGWYEVPPVARRHVSKPLVRGGFDAPTHPER
jgi:tRNA(Ile2)-agmatinylcytidine synthase